jgi:SAM-dependent methyltransferase
MSFRESVRKEWYRRGTRKRLASAEWSGRYWRDDDDARVVPCRMCPKFDDSRQRCSVPFGTPVRKCIVASLEAHLHGTKGLKTLELGYGKRSLAKDVVECSGGSWTGLEPLASGAAAIGSGGYGHAGSIPFPNETFDVVFGIQSLEHWEEKLPSLPDDLTYEGCLREVWRVLKPGGSIYFDAPIHLHGHEMFVLGDIPRVRALFDPQLWTGLTLEKWRYEHEPLPKYPTPEKESAAWASYLPASAVARLDEIRQRSVWLLALTARKRPSASGPDSAVY